MNSRTKKRIAIVGCGWLGEPLALHLLEKGYEVHGTSRTAEKVESLQSKGIKASIFDASSDLKTELSQEIRSCDTLFLNIPPGMRSAKDPEKAEQGFLDAMKLLLEQFNFSQTHLIAASSTSVYPDLNMEMDESFGSFGQPSGVAGSGLRKFERMCLDVGGFDTSILRFGGLYGGDRHPVKFFAGKTDLEGGMQRVNMVSLSRCIEVCERVISEPLFGEILNVVDEEHPGRAEFYTHAAKEKGLSIPSFKKDGDKLYGKLISTHRLNQVM